MCVCVKDGLGNNNILSRLGRAKAHLYSLQINNADTLTFTRARSGDRLNCAAAVTAILFWGELSREDEGLRHPGAFLWRQAG